MTAAIENGSGGTQRQENWCEPTAQLAPRTERAGGGLPERGGTLAVLETHPIQYHVPVYRRLQETYGIPVTAIYGSDHSVTGYRDREFGVEIAWDSDLLSGYEAVFLSRVGTGHSAQATEKASVRGLGRALREATPAVALVVGYHPWFHQVALWQARRAGLRVLFRGETTDHAARRGRGKAWIRDRALRWLYRRCDSLLYVGRHSLEHFRRLGCEEDRLFFSPYCVDAATFDCGEPRRADLRATTRQRWGLTESDRVFLFSGKLAPRKGPELLIQAVRELPAAAREHVVVGWLGSGELKGALEALASRTPQVKVRFFGFQNQSTLSPYYHAADLLVLPSLHSETWGLVVNEALHHGVPCVVSDAVGCAPDLVKPGVTGEVFRTGSTGSLASALQRAMSLVGHPEVRQGCRDTVGGYTVDRAAEGIARAYRRVVAGVRDGSRS
jgi:glycosyltransferase involved in cell wall biosynthesis